MNTEEYILRQNLANDIELILESMEVAGALIIHDDAHISAATLLYNIRFSEAFRKTYPSRHRHLFIRCVVQKKLDDGTDGPPYEYEIKVPSAATAIEIADIILLDPLCYMIMQIGSGPR